VIEVGFWKDTQSVIDVSGLPDPRELVDPTWAGDAGPAGRGAQGQDPKAGETLARKRGERMGWTPKAGMILKHKTIHQKVKVVGLENIPAGAFWLVVESDRNSVVDERPWMIGEALLVEQYDPVEERK
jgi:hypothetical protein